MKQRQRCGRHNAPSISDIAVKANALRSTKTKSPAAWRGFRYPCCGASAVLLPALPRILLLLLARLLTTALLLATLLLATLLLLARTLIRILVLVRILRHPVVLQMLFGFRGSKFAFEAYRPTQ
jgi:hypothetical protein